MIATVVSTADGTPRRVTSGAYVVPLRSANFEPLGDLPAYLQALTREVHVVVVDGSPPEVFARHATALGPDVTHIPVEPALETRMGKVGAVLTGLRHVKCERVVIADDDVRYDVSTLRRVLAWLDEYEVVRPQNYFEPAPWHALWDSSRSLINRAIGGGDWPGTLAVRRRAVLEAGGYRGDVMFENLELVRTVQAAGGRERVARDLYVARRPPTTRQFFGQRVRQAYDELARPLRALLFLGILPVLALLAAVTDWLGPAELAVAAMAIAEVGRRRSGGGRRFPFIASLLAPAWLLERGVTMWLALGCRVFLGGVPYRGERLRDAASSKRALRRAGMSASDPEVVT
ncbi:MAG: glycosyltransferase family 2 protein [Candidatus Dormibacteria bacterium]